jgi:hypothetical protein
MEPASLAKPPRSKRNLAAPNGIIQFFVNDEAAQRRQERYMTKIIYEVVEHDGGWAYQVDGVFLPFS